MPFNNTRNQKFISPPTVPFFAAVNHDLNICTSAINGPWKTETYKNNKMDRNPPITAKNVTFWACVNVPPKTDAYKMDRNPPVTANNMTFWPCWAHFIRFLRPATLIGGSENAIVCGYLNFRFCMLLKGAVRLSMSEGASGRHIRPTLSVLCCCFSHISGCPSCLDPLFFHCPSPGCLGPPSCPLGFWWPP